jgi:hypothetical protein
MAISMCDETLEQLQTERVDAAAKDATRAVFGLNTGRNTRFTDRLFVAFLSPSIEVLG